MKTKIIPNSLRDTCIRTKRIVLVLYSNALCSWHAVFIVIPSNVIIIIIKTVQTNTSYLYIIITITLIYYMVLSIIHAVQTIFNVYLTFLPFHNTYIDFDEKKYRAISILS